MKDGTIEPGFVHTTRRPMIPNNVSRPIPIRPKARRLYDGGGVTIPDISVGEQPTIRLPFPRLDEAMSANWGAGADGLSQTASKSWESVPTLDSCESINNHAPPVRNVLVQIPDDLTNHGAANYSEGGGGNASLMSYEDSLSTDKSKKMADAYEPPSRWTGPGAVMRTRSNAPLQLPSRHNAVALHQNAVGHNTVAPHPAAARLVTQNVDRTSADLNKLSSPRINIREEMESIRVSLSPAPPPSAPNKPRRNREPLTMFPETMDENESDKHQELPLRAERKMVQRQSLTSARYYGECHLDGIGPLDADEAMKATQVAFEKWWKNTNSGAVADAQGHDDTKKNVEAGAAKTINAAIYGGDAEVLPKGLLLQCRQDTKGIGGVDDTVRGVDDTVKGVDGIVRGDNHKSSSTTNTTKTRTGDLTRVTWRYEVRHDEHGETQLRRQKNKDFPLSSLSFNGSPPQLQKETQKPQEKVTPESPLQFPFANPNDSVLMDKIGLYSEQAVPSLNENPKSRNTSNSEGFSSSDTSSLRTRKVHENVIPVVDRSSGIVVDRSSGARNPSPKSAHLNDSLLSGLFAPSPGPLLLTSAPPPFKRNLQPFEEANGYSNFINEPPIVPPIVPPTNKFSPPDVHKPPPHAPLSSEYEVSMKTKPIPIPGSQQINAIPLNNRLSTNPVIVGAALPPPSDLAPSNLVSAPVPISRASKHCNSVAINRDLSLTSKRDFLTTSSSSSTASKSTHKKCGRNSTQRRRRSGCSSSCSSSSCGDRSTTSEVVLDLVEVDRRRLAAKAYRAHRRRPIMKQSQKGGDDVPESSTSSSSSLDDEDGAVSGSGSRAGRSRNSQSSGERTVKASNRVIERERKLLEDVQDAGVPSSCSSPATSSPATSPVENMTSDVSLSSTSSFAENAVDCNTDNGENNEKINDSGSLSKLTNSLLRSDQNIIANVKTALLHELAISGGDVTTDGFLRCLEDLRSLYHGTGWDARDPKIDHNPADNVGMSRRLEGMWLTLSRPNYQECLGQNSNGEYMYTLGRMSFDMFQPTNLVCSLQGLFNPIRVVDGQDRDEVECIPKALQEEIGEGQSKLRTYNIVTAFTIESSSPQFGDDSPNASVVRPIKGIMTTYGYILPDPDMPNRLSVWFSGGTIEVNDDRTDLTNWKRVFNAKQRRTFKQKAFILAAQMLMGAEVPDGLDDDGSMSYYLRRPIGGHGKTYVDVIYLDDSLRIMQGHHGTIYVFARVPSVPEA